MNVCQAFPLTETNNLTPLIRDYITGKSELTHLYQYKPHISSFAQAIADKSKSNVNRSVLVEVLQSQYAEIPSFELVKGNIASLADENTFTVTAAHQPCLFHGPLYNVYKIAATIRLAQQLKEAYPQNNFVPVFWLGSEDHDIEELNHAYINGTKIQFEGGKGTIGRLPASVVQQPLAELKKLMGENPLVNVLEEGIKKFSSFGRLTQYFLNELFGDFGLVVIDQDDKRLKNLFAQVIVDEVFNSRALQVLQENLRFLDKNYKVQAQPREINFFYLGEGFRERIIYNKESDHYTVNNTGLSFTKEQLKHEISSRPENFSPNVIHRPLFQEMILPNLAFVGGGGELSYWLELKPLFDYYRVNYPVLLLRNSAVIINTSVERKLQKLNLGVRDFYGDTEQLITNYIKQHAGEEHSLTDEKKVIEALYAQIAKKAEGIDTTLKQSTETEKLKALTGLGNLEAKMLKAEKRKQETTVNQIRTLKETLFPQNNLQERVENFIPYYSTAFVRDVVEAMSPMENTFVVFKAED
ncbi:MAG: bacillithiol biosynthesis cysteine-adding enzyme BshC [Chitinophagales bacterium]|nr:bacillithiol biosynthesis cysteine-adding enzyme BshC [Chitinophagales bacterium]